MIDKPELLEKGEAIIQRRIQMWFDLSRRAFEKVEILISSGKTQHSRPALLTFFTLEHECI